MSGPTWLGIGAQRCGTTWFVDLLTQHPEIHLVGGQKDMHVLHRKKVNAEAYRRSFPPGAGEFTPRYIRSLNAIHRVRATVDDDVPLIVILRDPVERFASAMRLRSTMKQAWQWPAALSDHQWAGMYADQLDVWSAALGRDRLVVLQYEQVVRDPQAHVERVWERLGLQPVTLTGTRSPSTTSVPSPWTWPDGLFDQLRRLYRLQLDRLVPYGIDPTLWPTTAQPPERADPVGLAAPMHKV